MEHFWVICKSLTCSDAFRHQCLIVPMGTLYKNPKTWASTRTSTGRFKYEIKSHILNFFNNQSHSKEVGLKFDFPLCCMIAHYWSPTTNKTKGTLLTKEITKNRNCWTKSSSSIGLCIWTLFEHPFFMYCLSQNEGNQFAKYLMKPCDDFTIWFCQERPRLRSAPPFPCGLTPLTVWVLPSTRKWRKLQIFAARHDYVVLQIWRCGSLSRDQATILAETWLFQGDCFTVCGSNDATWRKQ